MRNWTTNWVTASTTSYVRRYYVNKETNRIMNFSYELYSLDEGVANIEENVLALYGKGETVSISDLPGIIHIDEYGASVYWVDTERKMIFALYTDGVQPDELIKVALSVK